MDQETAPPADRAELYRTHRVESWAELYGPALYAYAMKRLRDPARAEEAVQEALLAALESLDRFEGRSTMSTWLTGILRHKILDRFRLAAREETAREEAGAAELIDRLYDERGFWRAPLSAWTVTPEEAAASSELRAALDACLAALPSRLSAAFHLRETEGMGTEEICKELNLTATNLWVVMHRARMRLRACLHGHGFGEGERAC